jgi:hypothetical protein
MERVKARDPTIRSDAFKTLHAEAKDVTFSNKFVAKQGLPLLAAIISELLVATNEKSVSRSGLLLLLLLLWGARGNHLKDFCVLFAAQTLALHSAPTAKSWARSPISGRMLT